MKMNTPERSKIKRIGPLSELRLLLRQAILLMVYDKRNLLISLCFPAVASLVTVFIAGSNMFVHYDGTKSACFVLSSAAIWCGLFNSIQIIVKERANIKRDYTAGMRLSCYVISKTVVQILLCFVQSVFLTLAFVGVKIKFSNDLPEGGLITSYSLTDFYITILLIMIASDAMGIFLSCLVKKVETANVMAPYILILELILSGVLFPLEGFFQLFSYIMISRWGMEALGSISNLNELPLQIQMIVPSVPHESEEMFLHTQYHLLHTWGILLCFSFLFILIGNIVLHRVAHDSR